MGRLPLKRRRRQKGSPELVQQLFDLCREIFSGVQPGAVPFPEDVERLQSVLGTIQILLPGDR